jgi:hypothetical protein
LLRHGFKAQSERRSAELRKRLGVADDGALEARELAAHLRVRIQSAADVPEVAASDLKQLTEIDADCWSAFTLQIGQAFLIIYNPAQSAARLNSVLMHEQAHIILGHELPLPYVSTTDDGCLVPSQYNQDQEDEANWLGGTLLLPRVALLLIRCKGLG